MRKRILVYCLFVFTVVFTVASCNDAIFFAIYQEVEPIDPRIKGAPSNFVVFKGAMIVASSDTIHRYIDGWDTTISPPGGRILQLASTSSPEYLYALCFNDNSSKIEFLLKRFDGNNWETLSGDTDSYNSIQHIFAAGNMLFIGAKEKADSESFTVLYVDNGEIKTLYDTKTEEKEKITGKISGASFAGGSYYISTRGNGVYRTNAPASGAELIPDSDGINFMGMINLNDNTIALITRGGQIHTVTAGNNSISRVGSISFDSRFASGALAIWVDKDDPSRRLLLAGRQDSLDYTVDSGYTYGYLELELDGQGNITGTEFFEPGKENRSITTIADGDNDRYISTIGKRPVNHLFQVPSSIDTDMILFASTQKNGVWSYRNRNGGLQWNAEE